MAYIRAISTGKEYTALYLGLNVFSHTSQSVTTVEAMLAIEAMYPLQLIGIRYVAPGCE